MSAPDRKDKSFNPDGVDITNPPSEEFDSPEAGRHTGSLQFGENTQESSWLRKALSTGVHRIKDLTGKFAVVELEDAAQEDAASEETASKDTAPEDPFSDMPRKIKVKKGKDGGDAAADYKPKWNDPQQAERARFEEGGDYEGEYTGFNTAIGEYMTTEKKRGKIQQKRSMRQQRSMQRQSGLRFIIRLVLIGAMIIAGLAAANYLSQWQQNSANPVAKLIKKKQKKKNKAKDKKKERKKGTRNNSGGASAN